MDNIFQIVVVFGAVSIIVIVAILVIYVLIVVINKKLGYDANGNQIKQVLVQPQQNSVQPQVIRIETVTPVQKEINAIENVKETVQMKNVTIEDDIPPFMIKNIEDVKIETSFNKKRIGKIENK